MLTSLNEINEINEEESKRLTENHENNKASENKDPNKYLGSSKKLLLNDDKFKLVGVKPIKKNTPINIEKIYFEDEENKKVDFPLFKNEKDIFSKDPFTENLIILSEDEDVKSNDDLIHNHQEFLLDELDFAIETRKFT